MEVDVWDGPGGEPIVYHGHTLTSRILFKDVVSTLAQYAFQVVGNNTEKGKEEEWRGDWLGLLRVAGQGV